MKTGIITTDTYQNHNTGDGHPEQIARVSVILENFKKINNKNLIWKKPSKVNNKILKTTHDSDYIDFVQNSFPKKGLSFLDGDTIISPGSKEATMDAVGSIITAIDGVQKKNLKMLFVQYVLLAITVIKIKRAVFAYIIIVLSEQIIY